MSKQMKTQTSKYEGQSGGCQSRDGWGNGGNRYKLPLTK